MRQILFTFILSFIILSFAAIQTAQCCFSEKEIENLDSKTAQKIFSILEKTTEEERDKYFVCTVGIYALAESILKSDSLTDVQKLKYYYRIRPLYPRNAELGSVLGYDTIKLFMKYKKHPIEQTVESIKNPKTRKYIRKSFIDADMLLD